MTAESLVEQARAAALSAYAPYSRFSVGCAVESVDGEIVVGANMENACYRLGICAEISALTAARQAFGLDKVARIAVAGGHVGADGALAGAAPVTPCGGCRQAIYEAADLSGIDVEVISANGDGTETIVSTIRACCPTASARPASRMPVSNSSLRAAKRRGNPCGAMLDRFAPLAMTLRAIQASLISRSRSWRYSSAVIGTG